MRVQLGKISYHATLTPRPNENTSPGVSNNGSHITLITPNYMHWSGLIHILNVSKYIVAVREKQSLYQNQQIGVFILSYFLCNTFFLTEGRCHDGGMLRDSHLYQSLERFAVNPLGQPMCLYLDPAYPLCLHLQKPYRNVALTPAMQAYSKAMSNVRPSVEWLFKEAP